MSMYEHTYGVPLNTHRQAIAQHHKCSFVQAKKEVKRLSMSTCAYMDTHMAFSHTSPLLHRFLFLIQKDNYNEQRHQCTAVWYMLLCQLPFPITADSAMRPLTFDCFSPRLSFSVKFKLNTTDLLSVSLWCALDFPQISLILGDRPILACETDLIHRSYLPPQRSENQPLSLFLCREKGLVNVVVWTAML